MDHFAGLDVSVKDTSVCIVDDMGRIAREVKIASDNRPIREADSCTAAKNVVIRSRRPRWRVAPAGR
jgi:hypothetical protein